MTTLRRVATTRGGAGFPHVEQGLDAGELPFIKVSDFNHPGNEHTITRCSNWISRAAASRLGASIVPGGALLLPKVGAALLGNARRLTSQPSVFDNNVLAVVPGEIESRYLHYWLSTVDAVAFAKPGPVPSMGDDALLDLVVPVEGAAEQQAIAAYLDAETARIDALIAKKQQLIHLLVERRSRLTLAGLLGELTHVGPVRDSGLAWAGTVPRHWEVALLRLVARQGTGHTPSRTHPEWWLPEECTVPWVTTGEVRQVRSDRKRVITETREKISHIGIAHSSAVIHPKGTVFLCRTASAGYSGIMGADMATSQDFATWTCGERLDPEYLLFCLRAMRADLLGRLATGSTHKTIYMPDIQALKIPVPPVEEQKQIAGRLKREIDRSFAIGDALTSQIDLLVEHREALITDAVSGEFTVPGKAL